MEIFVYCIDIALGLGLYNQQWSLVEKLQRLSFFFVILNIINHPSKIVNFSKQQKVNHPDLQPPSFRKLDRAVR